VSTKNVTDNRYIKQGLDSMQYSMRKFDEQLKEMTKLIKRGNNPNAIEEEEKDKGSNSSSTSDIPF
jgi:hypothetical protein